MQGDTKFFMGVLVVAAMVVGALVAFSSSGNATGEINTTDGHKQGPDSGTVKIVEFSDYQCPGCATVPPIMKEVLKNNPEKVQYILRHYPIPGHQYSRQAAQAAEAAGMQDKFWEMNDMIFANQQSWETSSNIDATFINYARELSLDLDKFSSDYSSSEVNSRIDADFQYGESLQVSSTPSFFVNSKLYEGNRSIADWQTIIDSL